MNERFDPPHPALRCRKSALPSPRWGEGAITAAVLCLLTLIATPAQAQDYPNRPITLVVPYAAGGGNDLFARIASEKMSRTLGQQIVIENRPGAGGSTATRAVAKAAPDGYTLVIGGTGTLAVNPTLYQNVGYDPRKDFAPVGLIGTSALVVLVNPNLPARSIPELIALAKKDPGKLNYASAGVGSGIHLGTVLFEMMGGIKLTHVPYRGSAPALTDLIGGHVSIYFSSLPPAVGMVGEGKVRALAVTPRPIIDKLSAALREAVNAPDTKERMAKDGTEPLLSTPEEYAADIDREEIKWSAVVKQSGAKGE
jgi:tripartite-type tricarboxylate transporter receptor subunit TctC